MPNRRDAEKSPEQEKLFREIIAAAMAHISEGRAPFPPNFHIPTYAEDVPEHVRVWVESKSREELERLDQMLSDYVAAKTIGKAGRWLVIVIAGFFGGSFALAKAGVEIMAWLKGWNTR